MKNMDELLAAAVELGEEHGVVAASWYFDGNTSEETYVAVLKGIRDGDPAVLDTFPSSPLSGEWADEMSPSKLYYEIGAEHWQWHDEGLGDDLCVAYEDAYGEAVQHELERICCYHIQP